jgi:hypothetical protein
MPTGPMMSGASPAAIRVASVVEASVLSTTVSVRVMPGFASLKAATTASSVGICSSFSPVPSPTNHSISTASAAGVAVAAAALLGSSVGSDAAGSWLAPWVPQAARTSAIPTASTAARRRATPIVRSMSSKPPTARGWWAISCPGSRFT